MNNFPPSVPLARLFEKRSRKGTKYFVGRLGLGKIVLLQSDEISESGEPIWILQAQEPAAKPPMKAVLATRASSLFLTPQQRPANSDLSPDPGADRGSER
jgi:hypothetical protein